MALTSDSDRSHSHSGKPRPFPEEQSPPTPPGTMAPHPHAPHHFLQSIYLKAQSSGTMASDKHLNIPAHRSF